MHQKLKILIRGFYRPEEEEVASWSNVVDFRIGRVKKEAFDRNIPLETSKEWGVVQQSVKPKTEQETNKN